MVLRLSQSLRMTACVVGRLLVVGYCVPALGAVTSTGEETSSTDRDVSSVKVNIQFVQVAGNQNGSAAAVSTSETRADPSDRSRLDEARTGEEGEDRTRDEGEHTYELAVRETAGWLDQGLRVQSVKKNGYLEYEGVRIELKDGVVHTPPPESKASNTSVRVLVAPSLQVEPGQPAEISVGEHVPYMEKQEDGSLIVKHSEETLEGIEIKVMVDEATPKLVSLDELSIKISKVVGRQPIPGIPFDVGRPIIRSAALATTLRLGYEHVVAISVPQLTDDQTHIVLLLSVEWPEE